MAKTQRPLKNSTFVALVIGIGAVIAMNVWFCLKHVLQKEPAEALKVYAEQLNTGDAKSKAQTLDRMVPLCARLREKSHFVQEPVARLLREHYSLVLNDNQDQDSSDIVIASLFILGNALPQSDATKALLEKIAAGPATLPYAGLARRALSRGTMFEAEKMVREASEMVEQTKKTLCVK